MSGRLAGKSALVLGVAPGNIGAAIASRYAEEGARVTIAGRRADALADIAAAIGAASQTCDITVEGDPQRLIADTAARQGGIDIGVNATGWGLIKPFLDMTRDDLVRHSDDHVRRPCRLYGNQGGDGPCDPLHRARVRPSRWGRCTRARSASRDCPPRSMRCAHRPPTARF